MSQSEETMTEHSPIIWREWIILKRAACTCGWVSDNRTKKHRVAMLDYRFHRQELWSVELRKRAEKPA